MNIGTFWDNRTLIENFCSNILSSSGNSGMSITFAPNKITPFGAISYIAIHNTFSFKIISYAEKDVTVNKITHRDIFHKKGSTNFNLF